MAFFVGLTGFVGCHYFTSLFPLDNKFTIIWLILRIVNLLAIDRGNSRTKLGIWNGDTAEIKVFINTQENAMVEYVKSQPVNAAIVSSVSAGSFQFLIDELSSVKDLILLDAATPLPVKNDYATPNTLGADRIAGAIGAWVVTGKSDVLLIDFGTCINIELVVKNHYKGGSISPGLQMRLKAMHDYTGALPLLTIPEEEVAFTGTSTNACMLSGAIHGTVQEVMGIISAYNTQYPGIQVVFTGGDAAYLGKYIKNSIFALNNNVVLQGLVEILKYNLNAKS